MYRLIACDLDETLLDQQKHVSKENQHAIQQAEEQGVFFIPATGRGFASIKTTLQELDALNRKNHFMIGFNGGVIVENASARVVHETPLAFDLLRSLFAIGLTYDVSIHVYTFEETYVYRVRPEEQAYLTRIPHQMKTEDSVDFLANETCYKVLFQQMDRSYLEQIEQALPADLKQALEISYSSNRYLEFNPKGVTKGAALRHLAEHLGISMEETLAIGDNTNDLSMISAAKLGVAVANAVPEVKKQAQHTTKTDHEHHAIREVLETFVLADPAPQNHDQPNRQT